ncbi:uncharacterized protein [Clytia hemisphaerica]|uniref:Cnidarian restricted protein n=1 Tax=Clytia hemisphaerica TaxID=252671 RepID=A0A7M5V664_9CNID
MNLWKTFLLAACFIAIANCKPERLEDVAKDEKLIESDEEEDVMLSNDKEEADTEDEPKSEELDEKKEDELSEDVVEKEFEEDEPAEESKENKDELIQKADPLTLNEEKNEEGEIVEDEHKDREERKPENDEKKKKDEKLTHNDPQVGYTLRKNFIHDALETWSPAYSISFQIKPLYIVNHWTSIIHFTTGGNLGAHGRRVPAVFIMPHTSRLHICTSLHNSNNWCVNSAALPLHKYSQVSINQYPNGGKYMYRVYVNGKQLANVENKTPRYFQNIKVYKADPWYNAASANIRYLYINDNQYARHPIRKNTLIKTFPTYFSEYEVSFRIRPTGKVNAWSNILHVTKGGDNGAHGDRIPGVWFWPNTNKLLIATSRSSNKNYYWTSPELPTNKDTEVNIKQKVVGCCTHYYTITIDKKVVLNVVNSSPRTFHNVRVYQGDPWYAPAKAIISYLQVTTTSGGGYKLSKGKVLRFIPRIEKQWYMSFDVKHVGSIKNHWTNVLHSTTGGNHGTFGYRIPAIWFAPNTRKLHICHAINNNHNYCFNTPNHVPFNKYTNVQIAQIYETDYKRYRYIILINRIQRFTIINSTPRVFHDVRLWGSDPWHNAANAFIKNLVFRSIPHKK